MSKADEIEEHINNLKEYCRIDRENITYEGDFGKFCKGHIEDIEVVLEELEKMNNIVKEMVKFNPYIYRIANIRLEMKEGKE